MTIIAPDSSQLASQIRTNLQHAPPEEVPIPFGLFPSCNDLFAF